MAARFLSPCHCNFSVLHNRQIQNYAKTYSFPNSPVRPVGSPITLEVSLNLNIQIKHNYAKTDSLQMSPLRRVGLPDRNRRRGIGAPNVRAGGNIRRKLQ
jgi:hypothetical protein